MADAASCQHDWQTPGESLALILTLEDWLGPTAAIARCRHCGTPALVYLVAWQGPRLAHRLFAVRTLPNAAAETYLHNVSRDYCDLTRKQSESEALLNAASRETWFAAVTLPDLVVESAADSHTCPPFLPWKDIPETKGDLLHAI